MLERKKMFHGQGWCKKLQIRTKEGATKSNSWSLKMFSNNGWCRWQFWKLFVDRNQSYDEYCVVDDDENIDESLLTKSEIDDDENIDASMLTKSEKTKEATDQRPARLSQLWLHMCGQDQCTPLWWAVSRSMFGFHFKTHLNYILQLSIFSQCQMPMFLQYDPTELD